MGTKVSENLKNAAEIYDSRNEIYSDTYKRVGHMMRAMFPDGIKLDNVSDFNRYGILHTMASKMCRYASCFELGGHADSLDDISVYAMMEQELDNE